MKHIFIALLSLITLTSNAQIDSKVFFEGQTINGLIANGAYEIKISQGEKTGVFVSANSNTFKKLNVTISENGIINVSDQGGVGQFFKSNKPMIKVVVSSLDMLSVGGAAEVLGSGEFTAQHQSAIEVTGSAYVEFIKVSAPNVFVSGGGAGAAKIGTTTINADTITVVNNGVCEITLLGDCKKLIISTNGTSSLNTLMLSAEDIDATCMGLSLVKAMVNNTAKVTASGVSNFKFTGRGIVDGKSTRL